MKQFSSIAILLLLAGGLYLYFGQSPTDPSKDQAQFPHDGLWVQRAFPYQEVPSEAYYEARNWATQHAQSRGEGLLDWVSVGPTNVGGRITDIAMHASDQQTIYAASASGGVWKSSNTGDTWSPISDALPTLSIGDIAIDPADKNVIYCGTGEPNGGGGSVTYDGRGLFRSNDAGNTWTSLGLTNTGSIGRVEIDPESPNRVFVAAMGNLFGNNADRGVFRTTDGGQSWDKPLFVNDSVGVIDLAIHPLDPDTIFAVTWQRIRRPNRRVYGGTGSGIWRSTDGGDNWTKLSGGLPTGSLGRIGIAIAPSDPHVMYATIANTTGSFLGVYKSIDHGNTWSLVPGGNPEYASFGWWFGQIRVAPTDPNLIFNLGVGWVLSPDGGDSWAEVSGYLHADYHGFYIHPANPNLWVVGNDGGVYISHDSGNTPWTHRPFPITQFYTSEIDYQNPTNFYGGTQDNGTWRTLSGGLDDWEFIAGGDGFVTLVNPQDNLTYYACSQYGGFVGSNGAFAPPAARFNWNTPYIFDPNNPQKIYLGGESLFASSDAGLTWDPISSDLSNGLQGAGGVVYGTITSIAASALNAAHLVVGTDDGNVWVTTNTGQNWTKVSDSLPKRWVTRVVTDLSDPNTIYVCLSGYRHFENIVHLYKSTDMGQSWASVSGNLPDVPINDLILDPLNPLGWIIATDVGVFSTSDGGSNWDLSSDGIPNVPILDLTFHAPTRTLAAASYGRAMFKATLPAPSGVSSISSLKKVILSPNPVANMASIGFDLEIASRVNIGLYDLSGKKVLPIFEGNLAPGNQQLRWSAAGLPAGVYLVHLRDGGKADYFGKVVVINK